MGFGPTKTLAKIANRFAKKSPWTNGVFSLYENKKLNVILEKTPITDIWGIGRKHGKRLSERGITTAREFRDLPNLWIKNNMSITGLQTALELRGKRCFSLENSLPQKDYLLFPIIRTSGFNSV